MTCNNRSANPDDRFINQQEHRNISRLWERAIQKLSSPRVNVQQSFLQDDNDDLSNSGRRGVRFGPHDSCENFNSCDPEAEKKKIPLESIQKKLAKGKSVVKRKSPLQEFDEIVTKELTSRRLSEEGGMPSFEGSKKWSTLQFTGSKLSEFGRSKISVDNKVSRVALQSLEKEVREGDPSEVQNSALMDAIEKLAQAQAFCRFNAAVRAAEAATASVPPERAEEVAVACAKDYQSEIVDVINEKIPLSEEKKPIEGRSFYKNEWSNVPTSINDLRYEFLKICYQKMNLQGFYKINEPEFPKSILKKKSQYDQKPKCQTENISKPVKTIRFTTEVQKKSKLISSLHSTLLSNKSNEGKEVKKNEKKRNRSDKQKNYKGEIEEKVENLQTRFELFKEETTGSQKKNDYNLSRLNKSGEKVIISKQNTEVAGEKHSSENGTKNLLIDEEKKLELMETEKVIMKRDSVDAGVRNNEGSHFSEHSSEEKKYIHENLAQISPEEKIVKKKRRRRRKRKRGNKGQLNNSNVYSLS